MNETVHADERYDEFKKVALRLMDYTEKEAKGEPDAPKLLKRCKEVRKLIDDDPRKFVRAYKRFTGATDWDLPDILYSYT